MAASDSTDATFHREVDPALIRQEVIELSCRQNYCTTHLMQAITDILDLLNYGDSLGAHAVACAALRRKLPSGIPSPRAFTAVLMAQQNCLCGDDQMSQVLCELRRL